MLIQPDDNIVESIERLLVAGWFAQAARVNDDALAQGLLTRDMHRQVAATTAMLAQSQPHGDFPGHEVYGVTEGMIVSSLQFRPLKSEREMRAAFKQAVNWIEIEPSSQCNRACHYCPNTAGHRRSTNTFMDPEVFVKFVADLQQIDYDGTIVLVGQNEFFMHRENFDYLAHIRVSLPRATIRMFSNGDYATRENLELAAECGVKEMFVTLHGAPGAKFDPAYVLGRVEQFRQRVGGEFLLEAYEKGARLNFTTEIGEMKLTVGAVNFDTLGHNWGGQLDFKPGGTRKTPCSYPLRQFVVNYAGDMFLCCVVPRDDNAENRALGTITGNLADHPSLFHAYASDTMRTWRESTFANRDLPKPCDTCTGHEGIDEGRFSALADHVAQHGRVTA